MNGPNRRSSRRTAFIAVVLLTIAGSVAPVRAQENTLSLTLRRTYTTTAQLYPNPSSPSVTVRNEFIPVEDLTGFAVDVQVPVAGDEFAVRIAAEYLSFVDEGTRPIALGGVLRTLPVRDGFFIVPVEVSGVAMIPLQSRTMRLSMAGGIGVTLGGRILEVAGAGVRSTATAAAVGIHVMVGFDYRVLDGIWLHGETRFRDPDVTFSYAFRDPSVQYNGSTIPLPSTVTQTRVNVDGMSVSIGLQADLAALLRP